MIEAPLMPSSIQDEFRRYAMLVAADTVLTAYIIADAYGIYHLIDDIEVNGKRFSSARDNGNGNNSSAGPDATTDPSLLPPIPITLP